MTHHEQGRVHTAIDKTHATAEPNHTPSVGSDHIAKHA